jgi:acyl-CoA oxidase
MIGQRLFTGRVAVAWAALTFRNQLFNMTREYAEKKLCWSPNGNTSLSSLPQLSAIFAESKEKSDVMAKFLTKCEKELSSCLKDNAVPPLALQEAIAVAKVRAVEESIDLCFRLKQEVGSFALMASTGFEQMDFLQCCKFAEGDSRILSQKIARDRFKLLTKKDSEAVKVVDEETYCANQLAIAMKESSLYMDAHAAWNHNHKLVYELANKRMDFIFKQCVS